ncbi:hypothetical protein V7793_10525 [Streptomyces sp. KLMMK]|uniref:hypothetical protein n=1 Tax=Streptomyces sp. KLMMK TaxID=3109353 RepID=UPI003009946A
MPDLKIGAMLDPAGVLRSLLPELTAGRRADQYDGAWCPMTEANRKPYEQLGQESAERLYYLSVAVTGEHRAAVDCLRYSLSRLAALTDDIYSTLPTPPPRGTVQCFAQAMHDTQMHILRIEALTRMHGAICSHTEHGTCTGLDFSKNFSSGDRFG